MIQRLPCRSTASHLPSGEADTAMDVPSCTSKAIGFSPPGGGRLAGGRLAGWACARAGAMAPIHNRHASALSDDVMLFPPLPTKDIAFAADVRCAVADISCARSLAQCGALAALPPGALGGVFHLSGVLDDGLIINQTPQRLRTAVAPKEAGLLNLLALCAARRLAPSWILLASSPSSLFGYAGQANYCAANAVLDQAAAFGAPSARVVWEAARDGGMLRGEEGWTSLPPPPRLLTINFGPWGEVGMALEGSRAYDESLKSGQIPLASADALACVAQTLRSVQAADDQLAPDVAPGVAPGVAPAGNMQFCVADVQWWRSPWPAHPSLQTVMRRVRARALASLEAGAPSPPPRPAAPHAQQPSAESAPALVDGKLALDAPKGLAGDHKGGVADGHELAEHFLRGRLSSWHDEETLTNLGLDSLDLVQLRNAFNKHFKREVPLAVFTNASQTLRSLLDRVGDLSAFPEHPGI